MKHIKMLLSVLPLVGILVFGSLGNQALAQKVIKVGAVQALRGAFGEAFLHINDGLKDALMMANDEGGINGKKLQYVMEPTDYNVKEAIAKFNEIFQQYHPPVMYGESTGMGLALADKIGNDYKVLYGSTSFSAILAQDKIYPSVFISGPTYGEQVGMLLKYIKKTDPNASVAFFYSDTAFGRDPIKYARIQARRLRIKIVAEVLTNIRVKDVTSEVLKLKSANPDYIIFQGFVLNPVPEVIRQCRELGMTCKFMGTFWTATKGVLEKLGPYAENYFVVNPYAYWWMTDVPMIRKIREYNAEHHPEITHRPNFYMQGFVTGLIFVEVLKRADSAGQLNYESLVKALHSLKNFETGGLTAPLTIKGNRFPVARIWKANSVKGIFEPAPLSADMEKWIRLD